MRKYQSQDNFNKCMFGCTGALMAFFVVLASFGLSPIVGIFVSAVIGWCIYRWFVSEAKEKRSQEEEHCKWMSELFDGISKSINDAKAKRVEDLTKDDFNCLGLAESGLSNQELRELCVRAFKAGNRYAIGLLLCVSERIIEDISPHEVIIECDSIIDLISNSRSFYSKGMALKQLKRYDEAIVEIENAIIIDQSEDDPDLKFQGFNLKLAQKELEQLACLARRMHIEKDGDFNLVKSGTEYENFICGIFRRQGCSCRRVGSTGDYGADIIATLNSGTLVVQCKFYSSSVGYDAVQQVYTAKAIYNGTWCCVVSNATFTRQAIEGARKLGVSLLSHVDIAEYLRGLDFRGDSSAEGGGKVSLG